MAWETDRHMGLIVLIIHLFVCACLIGLVLLQRSEGGALGMGGGSGGALMSGRGAADALAKMTSVAGGFFILTSLTLTVISGAASTSNRSVMDLIPSTQSAPATTTAPAATEPAVPATTTTPDPTEGRAPSSTQLVTLGPREAAASTSPAPAPSTAATRAGPIEGRSTQTASTQRQTTTVNTTAQPRATVPAAATQQRSTPATTLVSAPSQAQRPAAPATNGSVTGIDLTSDPQLATESGNSGNGVAAVRRERAGPDQ